MGDLIFLSERRPGRSRVAPSTADALFFDLSCPLSYLAAERIERVLGEVEWVPVSTAAVLGDRKADVDALQRRAESRARALRLPLVWPDSFPDEVPCALRAAVYAAEAGAGARFALAASRLAFCGGFNLEDPEMLAEAAAAAGLTLEHCLAAAGDAGRDAALRATAAALRAHGVRELPAIRIGQSWFAGESGLLAAGAKRQRRVASRRPLEVASRPLAPAG